MYLNMPIFVKLNLLSILLNRYLEIHFPVVKENLLPEKVLDPDLAESELQKLRSPHLWSWRTVKYRILTIRRAQEVWDLIYLGILF